MGWDGGPSLGDEPRQLIAVWGVPYRALINDLLAREMRKAIGKVRLLSVSFNRDRAKG